MKRSKLIELLNSIEIEGQPDPQVRFNPVEGRFDVETHSAYIGRERDSKGNIKEDVPPYIVLKECVEHNCELCKDFVK